MSDAACGWPRRVCLELQSDLEFVAVSAGLGCVQEGLRYALRPAFTITGLPWNPEICLLLPLPAGCLLGCY